MCVRVYLQVVLGVPVGVEDDAGVRGGEVDSQPPRPRAQQEHKAVRVGPGEAIDGSLPEVPTHAPVDALVRVADEEQGRFQYQASRGRTFSTQQVLKQRRDLCIPVTTVNVKLNSVGTHTHTHSVESRTLCAPFPDG